jgi:hypothetical protein
MMFSIAHLRMRTGKCQTQIRLLIKLAKHPERSDELARIKPDAGQSAVEGRGIQLRAAVQSARVPQSQAALSREPER